MNEHDGKTAWSLEDAAEVAARAPYTFYRPSAAALARLEPGNLVKLIFRFDPEDPKQPAAERMWVKITSVNGDRFAGVLDNDPVCIKGLAAGDRIAFSSRHIINTDLKDPVADPTGPYNVRCFVTKRVLKERRPIGYFYREEPDSDKDSGWRILCGDETDDYLDEPGNIEYVALGAVLNIDDSILELLAAPAPCAFLRDPVGGEFRRVEPPGG
jgi:hypothetical protein